MGSSWTWAWSEWVFLTKDRSGPLPSPLVAQECEKYGMRAVFDSSLRTYLIGSENTLYGVLAEESCSETDLEAAIAELFVTGPFRSIPANEARAVWASDTTGVT